LEGIRHGMQIGYREDGSKAMETLYENGKEISRKEL
jgi:antitoxin component YwqK of YwqJK toxin-antitoxin module